jgi:hypothetical protein
MTETKRDRLRQLDTLRRQLDATMQAAEQLYANLHLELADLPLTAACVTAISPAALEKLRLRAAASKNTRLVGVGSDWRRLCITKPCAEPQDFANLQRRIQAFLIMKRHLSDKGRSRMRTRRPRRRRSFQAEASSQGSSPILREARAAGAELVLGVRVDAGLIRREAPDAIVLATGAVPQRPEIEDGEEMPIIDAADVLVASGQVGAAVVIADERCDWVGMGVAEKLVREGRWVRLCVMGHSAGQELESMTRHRWLGILDGLGVEIITHLRLAGVAADSVYFQHLASRRPVACEKVDTLVFASGCRLLAGLRDEPAGFNGQMHLVGDCRGPRTAEEAVYEGLMAGLAI